MSTVNAVPLVIDDIRPAGSPSRTAAERAAVRPDAGHRVSAGQIRAGERLSGEGALPDSGQSLSFWDFLDIINPLQHLPIVSTIYREVTGDTINPAARVAGGALYGGPLGAGAAVATQVAEQIAGIGPDETVLSLFQSDTQADPAMPGATQVAAADEAPSDAIARYAADAPHADPVPADDASAAVQVADASPAATIAGYASGTPQATASADQAAPAAEAEVAAAPVASRGETAFRRNTPASFMPIRPSDFRTAGAPVRMPVPEERPAGLPPREQMATASASASATARPAPEPTAPAEPAASAPPSPVLSALQAQGIDTAEAATHPMIQAMAAGSAPAAAGLPTEPAGRVEGAATGATASESVAAAQANTPAAPVQGQDGWFGQAMMQALDRYEQSGRLARHAGSRSPDIGV